MDKKDALELGPRPKIPEIPGENIELDWLATTTAAMVMKGICTV